MKLMSVTQKGAFTLTPVLSRTLHYCNIILRDRNKSIQVNAVVEKERERKKEGRRTRRKRIIEELAKGRKEENKRKAPKIPIRKNEYGENSYYNSGSPRNKGKGLHTVYHN